MITFDPVNLTIDENKFLLENLGKPTLAALKNGVPAGVSYKVIKDVLDACNEYERVKEHDGTQWAGFDAVKAKIQVYIEQSAKWAADKRLGRPRFPSMYSFDGRGKPHWGGVGSDSGHVKTYFDSEGNRIPFAIDLVDVYRDEYVPEWAEKVAVAETKADAKDGVLVDNAKQRIECLICNHVEKFRVDSRRSYNAARGRMSKHLRNARERVDEHREAHTLVFG